MSALPARRTPHTSAAEKLIAPHVDPRWAEAVLVELRLLGVDGPRIGAVLAEVESHCTESGESARDAFGDPVGYARSLDLPTPEAPTTRGLARAVVPTVAQLVGMYLMLWSATDVLAGRPVELTAGQLAAFGVLLAGVAAITRWVDPLVRSLTATGPLSGPVIRVVLLMWLFVGAMVALTVALDDVLVRAPATVALVTGAVVLAAGTVAALRRADGDSATAVVPPLPAAPGTEAPGPQGAAGFLAGHLTAVVAWMIPVGTLVLLGLELALER